MRFSSSLPTLAALVRPLVLALVSAGALVLAPSLTARAQVQSIYVQMADGANGTLQPVSVEEEEELLARNHGTGLRAGMAWSGKGNLEIGAFHQRALTSRWSVQAEALYYHQRLTTSTGSGLRLPVMLVANPFYNVSVHAGPQLQWQLASTTRQVSALDGTVPATTVTPTLTAAMVLGTEARIEMFRVGMRFTLPVAAISNQAEAGRRIANDWRTGQVQAYIGIGF